MGNQSKTLTESLTESTTESTTESMTESTTDSISESVSESRSREDCKVTVANQAQHTPPALSWFTDQSYITSLGKVLSIPLLSIKYHLILILSLILTRFNYL